jgi:hypothetical protein
MRKSGDTSVPRFSSTPEKCCTKLLDTANVQLMFILREFVREEEPRMDLGLVK